MKILWGSHDRRLRFNLKDLNSSHRTWVQLIRGEERNEARLERITVRKFRETL